MVEKGELAPESVNTGTVLFRLCEESCGFFESFRLPVLNFKICSHNFQCLERTLSGPLKSLAKLTRVCWLND